MTAARARILLVDPDIDALASLATALRQRGFGVVLANGPKMACERAMVARFDLMVLASDLVDPETNRESLTAALASAMGATLPPCVFVVKDREAAWGDDTVVRGDVDAIAARALALSMPVSRESTEPPSSYNVGSIASAPLLDVVRRLHEERKTGTLSITTGLGAGELRLSRGELVDAVYLGLEGRKALLRVLAEEEGTFVFTTSTPIVMRRLTMPTRDLLGEADREIQRGEELRKSLRLDEAHPPLTIVVQDGEDRGLSELATSLAVRMRAPFTLPRILDESAEPDVEILEALVLLDHAGRLVRVENAPEKHSVGGDDANRMRALAAAARADGFSGPGRLVFAASSSRLVLFAFAALGLEEAAPPAYPPPGVPAPYEIATLRFADGVAIELVALPLVPAYSPTWPLVLAGAKVVVRLDDAASELLEELCLAQELKIVEAQALVGQLDEANVEHVRYLVRCALEATEG